MKIVNFQPQNTKALAASSTALKYQAVAYYNGKIYTFGGENTSGTVVASSFSYDISTDTWSSITALPAAASYSQCWVSGGLIYIQGGKSTSGSTPRSALYSYNPSTNAYTTLASGGAIAGANCTVMTVSGVDYLFYFGGYSNNTLTSVSTSIRQYTISSNTWAIKTPTISSSYSNTGIGFNISNKMYFLQSTGSSLSSLLIYDPSTDTTSGETFTNNFNIGSTSSRFNTVTVGNTAYFHGLVSSSSSAPTITSFIVVDGNLIQRGVNKFGYDCQRNGLVTDGTKIYAITGTNQANSDETRIISYTPDNQGSYSFSTSVSVNDFSGGSDFTSNGWTVVNGTQTNKWQVGTAGGTGTTGNSAYISNDGGVTKGYTFTSQSTVHFYRDITFDSDKVSFLKLFLNVDGESLSTNLYDYIEINISDTSFTPVAGTLVGTNGTLILKKSFIEGTYSYNFQNYVGLTKRLIFTWRNDTTQGTTGGGAVVDTVVIDKYTIS